MNTILQTKGLCKTYIVNKRQNNVLKNIDLTITEGEMVAVMGPSGSGKSTLMNVLYGLYKPTSGSIAVNGKEVVFTSGDTMSLWDRQAQEKVRCFTAFLVWTE